MKKPHKKFVYNDFPRDGYYMKNFYDIQPALNYGYLNPDPNHPWEQGYDEAGPTAVRNELKNIIAFWCDKGVDGFRVDMAASLVKADEDSAETIKLWQDFRAFLDKEYPHCAMVSEWGVPAKSIEGGFHMDFMLHFGPPAYTSLFRSEHPFFSREGKGDIRIFLDAYLSDLSSTQKKGLICIPSSNHDMPRLARGRDVRDLKICFAFLLTMAGAPFIYYGDEIGMQGYRDPFNRGYYCWDSHEERLKPVLAQLAQLRHSCEAFRTGALRVLRAEGGVLHYQRVGATETAEIIVNRSEHIIVEPLASGKHTEVNPMGFTIVVEENGHNPNHSYYDIQ